MDTPMVMAVTLYPQFHELSFEVMKSDMRCKEFWKSVFVMISLLLKYASQVIEPSAKGKKCIRSFVRWWIWGGWVKGRVQRLLVLLETSLPRWNGGEAVILFPFHQQKGSSLNLMGCSCLNFIRYAKESTISGMKGTPFPIHYYTCYWEQPFHGFSSQELIFARTSEKEPSVPLAEIRLLPIDQEMIEISVDEETLNHDVVAVADNVDSIWSEWCDDRDVSDQEWAWAYYGLVTKILCHTFE